MRLHIKNTKHRQMDDDEEEERCTSRTSQQHRQTRQITKTRTLTRTRIDQVVLLLLSTLLIIVPIITKNGLNYVIADDASSSFSVNSDGSIDTTTTSTTTITKLDKNNNATGNNNVIISKHWQLKKMPNYDYEAFVRPHISSYYKNNNNDDDNDVDDNYNELEPDFKGVAGKFVNMSPIVTSLWWVGESGGVSYMDDPILMDERVQPWGSGGTASYPTHVFILTEYQKPNNIICTFTVQPKICVYYCDPYIEQLDDEDDNDDTYIASKPGIVTPGKERQLSSLSKTDRANYDIMLHNLVFGDEYYKFTNGSPWLTTYPPVPFKMNIWPTDYFGQIHNVVSTETHFNKPLPIELRRLLSMEEMANPTVTSSYSSSSLSTLNEYRIQQSTQTFQLKVISCMPKVLEIDNFLSSIEIEHMLSIVQQLQYERSSTGGGVVETRTSRTTWINRQTDPIVNSIHRRAADVLGIHESLLRQRTREENTIINATITPMPLNTLDKINEDLQIVHYGVEQEYESHHDFGFPSTIGIERQLDRYVNIALYLNNVTAGGHTSFPRWRSGTSSDSLKVTPIAGKAVIFYMALPDGNFDDLSQHAGMPVLDGEKYFVNLWVRSFI